MPVALEADFQIRALFQFTGATARNVYVTDRTDTPPGDAECRMEDWGEVVASMDQDDDSVTLVVNNFSLSGSALPSTTYRFSELWTNTQSSPEGTSVQIEVRNDSTANFATIFSGAIDEVSEVSEQRVVIVVGSKFSKFKRTVGEVITKEEFPSAETGVVGTAKPMWFGSVKEYTPPKVRDRARATLETAILAGETISNPGNLKVIQVDTSADFPEHGIGEFGFLRIDQEVFQYTTNGVTDEESLILQARAQLGTVPAAHEVGDAITERAKQKWMLAGHPMSATPTAVYGLGSQGQKILIDPSDYTFTNGVPSPTVTNDPSFVELNSEDGLSISVPSDTPTYRRIELDVSATPKPAQNLPAGFVSDGTEAANASFAAGDAGSWTETNFAVLRRDNRDTLALKRSQAFDIPSSPVEGAWIAVEHWGLVAFSPKSVLVGDYTETDLNLSVENRDELAGQDTVGGNAAYVVCNGEIMRVSSWGNQSVNVIRGQLGTAARSHATGDVIQLYQWRGDGSFPGGVEEERIYHPQLYVLLEDANGDMQPVGKILDNSDVPPEIPEKANGYQDTKELGSFHGHPVQGLPLRGKWINPVNQFFGGNPTQYTFSSFVGSLLPATILNKGNTSKERLTYPTSNDLSAGYELDDRGYSMVLNPETGSGVSIEQRVATMTVRYAAAGVNDNSSVLVDVWINDPATGLPRVFSQTKTALGPLSWSRPPDHDTFRIKFNETTEFNDGLKFKNLLSRHFTIRLSRPQGESDPVRLYWVSVDFKFEPNQLTGKTDAQEFLGDRSVIEIVPSFAYANDADPYSNNGLSGPEGNLAGTTNYDSNKILPGLMTPSLWPFLTRNTGTGPGDLLVVDRNGVDEKILVRLSTDGNTTNDVRRARLYCHNMRAPSSATIKRFSLLMRVAGKAGKATPLNVVMRFSGGPTLPPNTEDDGSWSNYDGASSDLSVRMFRYSWNLNGDGITVKEFQNSGYIEINATGGEAGDTSDEESVYTDHCVFNIEIDEDRTSQNTPLDGGQVTRVKYIDVSSQVTDYADLVDRQIEVRLAKQGWSGDPGHYTTQENGNPIKVIAKDDKNRPILIPRVWLVFKFFDSQAEELTRIAVDGVGLEAIPGTNGNDTISNVVTYGPPLLNAPSASDLDAQAFFNAVLGGWNPLRGVRTSVEDARQVLRDFTEQAMVSGFWDVIGRYTVVSKYDPNTALPPLRFSFFESSGHILEDTLTIIRRPKDTVRNKVTVNALPDYINGGWRINVAYQAPNSIAAYGESPYEINADMIDNKAHAENLCRQVLKYGKEPETLVSFQTSVFTQVYRVLRGNRIRVSHSLYNSDLLEVLSVRKRAGNMDSIPVWQITCREIDTSVDEEQVS